MGSKEENVQSTYLTAASEKKRWVLQQTDAAASRDSRIRTTSYH